MRQRSRARDYPADHGKDRALRPLPAQEPLGAGGSAQVWRAIDTRTGDTVAVKRLHPLVFADEAGRERLLREFRALRDLDEANIVRVRDLELTEDDGALILDYVAGPSLATRLANGDRLSTAEAVSIALDVAAALAAAHAAGIVHRDVTPGNILLDPDDGARLTDFGIALGGAGTNGEPALTATGELVGTLRYLAPEQLRGAPATPASDVHALAAVLYEMLAGRPAYPAASPVALAEAQARGVDPIPSVPPALDAAVRRGLAPEPADRPADAASFATELEAAVSADRTEPIAAAASPAPARSMDGPLWAPIDADSGAEAPPPPNRRGQPSHPARRHSRARRPGRARPPAPRRWWDRLRSRARSFDHAHGRLRGLAFRTGRSPSRHRRSDPGTHTRAQGREGQRRPRRGKGERQGRRQGQGRRLIADAPSGRQVPPARTSPNDRPPRRSAAGGATVRDPRGRFDRG